MLVSAVMTTDREHTPPQAEKVQKKPLSPSTRLSAKTRREMALTLEKEDLDPQCIKLLTMRLQEDLEMARLVKLEKHL